MDKYFGHFGGQFVAETLMPALEALEQGYEATKQDPSFQSRLEALWHTYAGRPTPLTPARRLSALAGGARIYLKREDLAHTGAHKINNALGQVLLAEHLGKRRIVAETGAGQHGVATATACALFGLECVIYMGALDMQRQVPNVQRMKLLGADVCPVYSGTQTLKDAINEAIRDWITNVHSTHYLLGSVVGPHPFPTIVQDFQSMIGRECLRQVQEACGTLPDSVVACVGGGSNSIGIFSAFLNEDTVRLIGVEAGGPETHNGHHAAPLIYGSVGVLHGCKTYVMQDADGQILEAHSIAPGLDYPSVGPVHSYLRDQHRVEYTTVTDQQALEAFVHLSRAEGIIPALESAHAVAKALDVAASMRADQILVINLSGRGDKDLDAVLNVLTKTNGRP